MYEHESATILSLCSLAYFPPTLPTQVLIGRKTLHWRLQTRMQEIQRTEVEDVDEGPSTLICTVTLVSDTYIRQAKE